MYDLHMDLDDLEATIPCIHTHGFNGQRDLQDFTERDFDRRLEVIKTRALINIAHSLELFVNEEVFGDIDS